MSAPLQRRFSFRAPWRLFWVGLALRLAAILIGHTYRIPQVRDHFGFAWEAGRIAQSLATGHGYGNPFNGPSGPSAWLSPLYPLLIALSFKLFGVYSRAAALFLMTCDSVFSAAIAPAVYEIAARCFDARGLARRAATQAAPVALWAGWLWAVYPAFLQYAVHWLWEMSLSTFLFTWALVLALRLRHVGEPPGLFGEGPPHGGERPQPAGEPSQAALPAHNPEPDASWGASLRTWTGFGVLWGLLALSNPSLLPCLPAVVVWILWPQLRRPGLVPGQRANAQIRRTAAGAALAGLIFALILLPWVVRNERVLHAFVPTRSNGGAELYESTLESNDAFPWGTTLPLWPGMPEFQRFVRLGEIRYSKLQGQRAMVRLRAHPARFARYTLDRFLFFWDGTPHPPEPHPGLEFLRQLNYASWSALGLLGLGLMLRQRVPGGGLFALAFLIVPLPYYVITVQPRFRHPIEPLIAVLSVYLIRSAETNRAFSRPLWRR